MSIDLDEELGDSAEQEALPEEPKAEAPAAPDEHAAAAEAVKADTFDEEQPFEPTSIMADSRRMKVFLKKTIGDTEKWLHAGKGGKAPERAIELASLMSTVQGAIPTMIRLNSSPDLDDPQEGIEKNKIVVEEFMRRFNKLQRSQKEFQTALITYEDNPDKLQEEVDRIMDDMEEILDEMILSQRGTPEFASFFADRQNSEILDKRRQDLKARQEARKSKT